MQCTVLRSMLLFAALLSLDVTAQSPPAADCKAICVKRLCSSGICGNLYLGCDCDTHSEPRLEINLMEHISIWNILMPLLLGGGAFLVCVRLGICVVRCVKRRRPMARQPRVTIHHQDPQTAVRPPEWQGDSPISSSCTGACTSSDIKMSAEGNICLDIEINGVDSNPITNSIPFVEALVSPTYEVIPETVAAAVPATSTPTPTEI